MSHPYPQNLPYMQGNSNASHPNNQDNKPKQDQQETNPQLLMSRIQDLEKQLVSLNTMLTEDGGFQQAYNQLQQQNQQLKALIHEQQTIVSQAKQMQISNQLLKQNLLKQNEEMEQLYQQLMEARNSQSRMQERGQSQYLQSKVQELNDQISNLLVKIQQLVDQNNERQNNQQQMSQQFQNIIKQYNEGVSKAKNLQVQNQILKEQIHNMEEISINQQKQIQDRYMKQMDDLIQQINQLQTSLQKKPGQIKSNTQRITQDRIALDQQIISLRNQLASKNEQLLWQKDNEVHLRRKLQQRIIESENQVRSLNEEVNKLRSQLRREENKYGQLQFTLEQQQRDRQRLNFYKNNYAESEQLRNTIVKLQAQKQELRFKIQKLQVQLSQSKFQPIKQAQKNNTYGFIHEQAQDELQKSKKLNKELKMAIGKYEEDYRQLRKDYEKLLEQKCQAQRFVTINQLELNKHKTIYEQLIVRYNQTASLYKEVEHKLKMLQKERSQKNNKAFYDKEDIQLIKLQNSALRQEINHLKQEITSSSHSNRYNVQNIQNLKQQTAQSKKKQRQYAQQLQIYRQKYLKELQKSKGNDQLQNKARNLEEKLTRVNRMLNEKLKELQYFQNRQKELMQQVDKVYIKCKLQFDNYGIRHHPQIKKLQSELLSAQRQIMESELAFKQQINNCEDELRLCRLQNQHHRAKIDQLLLEVNKQRNNLDYSKVMRSLELSQLTQKELRRQIDHKDNLIHELRDQLKKNQNRQRNRLQNPYKNQFEELRRQKERNQQRLNYHESNLRKLDDLLNKFQGVTSSEDTLKRAINFISKIQVNRESKSQQNQTRQGSYSRYEELARKKLAITQQFKQSQKFLYEDKWNSRQEKPGIILNPLRQNLAV